MGLLSFGNPASWAPNQFVFFFVLLIHSSFRERAIPSPPSLKTFSFLNSSVPLAFLLRSLAFLALPTHPGFVAGDTFRLNSSCRIVHLAPIKVLWQPWRLPGRSSKYCLHQDDLSSRFSTDNRLFFSALSLAGISYHLWLYADLSLSDTILDLGLWILSNFF